MERILISNIHEFSPIDRTTSLYIAVHRWKSHFAKQPSGKNSENESVGVYTPLFHFLREKYFLFDKKF